MGARASVVERESSDRDQLVGVIDCDVHPLIPPGLKTLFPYLSLPWRKRLEPYADHEVGMGRARHLRGDGVLSRDATPPSGGPPGSDPRFMVDHLLDPHGIARAVLFPIQASYVNVLTDPDEAAVLATAYNDYMVEHWLSVDPRYRLAMTVAPQDPLLAAAEIRRLATTKNVVAIWLPTVNILLGNRHYNPIYEAAQDADLVITCHENIGAGMFQGNATFAGGQPNSYCEQFCVVSQLAMGHIASLIFEGTFERFPRLRVAFVEYGWTWLPSLMWRMDSTWKAGRKTVPWVKRTPSEYVLDHIRFTSEPALEPPNPTYLRHTLEMMSADRTLLFATDYPHWDADEPSRVFNEVPEDLRQRIFRDSAIDLFGERIL